MDYSGDVAIPLEQLWMKNVKHYEASNTLKSCKENRAACFKDFRAFGNQLSERDCKRKALEEAIIAEKIAREYLKNVTKELQAEQSTYDKMKLLAASAKKAQKNSEACEKKRGRRLRSRTSRSGKNRNHGKNQKRQGGSREYKGTSK